jgi:hypothetical protein
MTAARWLTAAAAVLVAGVRSPHSSSCHSCSPGSAVLGLSLLVPAYLLAAVWLWRRQSWGFLLAAAILVAGALHQVSYIAGMLFQLAADIPGAAFDTIEPIIVALYALAAGLLFANLRTTRSQPAHTPVAGGR